MPGIIEPRRDGRGRYLIAPEDGGDEIAYDRATTVAGVLDDRHNIERWLQRSVATGIARRPDLYARVASTPVEDKRELDGLCQEAISAAGGDAKANLGTAIHKFLERSDSGEDVAVPEAWAADVAAYDAALIEEGITINPHYVERVVVCDSLPVRVAGTIDRIVGSTLTEQLHVFDLKTGSVDYAWGKIAVQLAIYSRGSALYNVATGEREPMPEVDQDWGIVAHLPVGAGHCDLYWVDLNAGWAAAQVAVAARTWRRVGRKVAYREHPTAAIEAVAA
jgi:hypothetical protein